MLSKQFEEILRAIEPEISKKSTDMGGIPITSAILQFV